VVHLKGFSPLKDLKISASTKDIMKRKFCNIHEKFVEHLEATYGHALQNVLKRHKV
jgi:hypothetical protein